MYVQPKDLDEALGLLAIEHLEDQSGFSQSAETVPWAILSGGTDFYPAALEGSMSRRIMDIHALAELKTITLDHSGVRIGAGVTWSDLIACELPSGFDALKLAAREVGSVQIQNKATVAGNLCNASPAADGVPPLLILDASVELSSHAGSRQLPLQEFILGNRQTARRPDEMVTAIWVPADATHGKSSFLKLGSRKYLIISISMVAARIVGNEEGLVTQAAISVGACSLVAQRLTTLEADLLNQPFSGDLAGIVTAGHFSSLSPIDDVRSSGHYRIEASLELVRRLLNCLTSKPA